MFLRYISEENVPLKRKCLWRYVSEENMSLKNTVFAKSLARFHFVCSHFCVLSCALGQGFIEGITGTSGNCWNCENQEAENEAETASRLYLITTPLLQVWGQSAEVWLLFFLSMYIFLLFYWSLSHSTMDNTQKAEIPTLAALPALLPTTTTECISQHLEQLSVIPNDLIRLHTTPVLNI